MSRALKNKSLNVGTWAYQGNFTIINVIIIFVFFIDIIVELDITLNDM